MTTIRIEIEPSYVDQVVAYVQTLPSDKKCITIEKPELNGKLTHEELMALPEDERMKYYDANGGVLAVAEENGYVLPQDAADDILEYIRHQR